MFQLKISLRDSAPPVWRRVLVHEQISLSKLHTVIQLAFGWCDEHMYLFEKERKGYPESTSVAWGEDVDNERIQDATTMLVWAALQKEGEKLTYTYDFGDEWCCFVVLEKCIHYSRHFQIMCMGGKGTTPAENSGGLQEYYGLLQNASEFDSPDMEDLNQLLSRNIEHRRYNRVSINGRLQALN